MKTQKSLFLQRTVRFGDIDSAGVIHFHNLFRWCHEAWEESMESYGLKMVDIFPSSTQKESSLSIALPIVHCESDFFAPIFIGDELDIHLIPTRLNLGSFQVQYKFQRGSQNVAVSLIRHRSINSKNRELCDLPEILGRWIEESIHH